jgi:D-serine deaminase-like pyridoxal phosphate-dependent protein
MTGWFRVNDTTDLLSPSLVVDRGLVARNLDTMVSVARDPARLRPHVKTHKMPAIVRICEARGVNRHKCATIAEAEMTAEAGGTDVMLAYPLVGPNVARLAALVRTFPGTTFRATVDEPAAARALSEAMQGLGRPLPVMVDLDVGMGRTGIAPGDGAVELYELIDRLPNLVPDGLSVYDGHNHELSMVDRAALTEPVKAMTFGLRDRLLAKGLPVPRLVMGGTPTFALYAALDEPGIECSPGTTTLHDVGYATLHPELPYSLAAAVLTRVISRPRPGRLCLDLGHKAVAADPDGPRVTLPDLPGATLGRQNEEHLVVDTPDADRFPPGTAMLAFPTHICPTCALHRRAYVVENGVKVDEWEVQARDRMLHF